MRRGGSISEADAAIRVAMQLVDGGEVDIDDILIIAPHFLQMQVIRSQAKRSRHTRALQVDSITNVQGREFSVLIISTLSKFARTVQAERVAAGGSDAAGDSGDAGAAGAGAGASAGAGAGAGSAALTGGKNVGRATPVPTLLDNPRLFNTVVTRAQRLVVTVGNPGDLRQDITPGLRVR